MHWDDSAGATTTTGSNNIILGFVDGSGKFSGMRRDATAYTLKTGTAGSALTTGATTVFPFDTTSSVEVMIPDSESSSFLASSVFE